MSDLSELIGLLSSKTREGKLKWQLDGERRIFIKQGESVIDIETAALYSGFKITVRNLNGVSLASDLTPLGSPENRKLSDIFTKASHDALGVDQALDALKSSLLAL